MFRKFMKNNFKRLHLLALPKEKCVTCNSKNISVIFPSNSVFLGKQSNENALVHNIEASGMLKTGRKEEKKRNVTKLTFFVLF